MEIKHIKSFVISLLIVCLSGGCQEQEQTKPAAPVSQTEMGLIIGELTEIVSSEPIAVEGYGLVGGLRQTGSPQCPVQIRSYLQQYILKQLPEEQNADRLINSPNTAVVQINGTIPATASKGDRFDVKVVSLAGTQTTSLEGGTLWTAELKAKGRFGISSKTLAIAEGPIYIEKIDAAGVNKKEGFLLGGGQTNDNYPIIMVMRQPGYRNSAQIRNRINERFGLETAKARMPDQIDLTVPARYKGQKQKFISLLKATFLNEDKATIQQRTDRLVYELAQTSDKDSSEIALEAIGTPAAEKIASLLNSPQQEIRLRAARCLLNMGDDRGLQALRDIALDTDSPHRIMALEAIGYGARRNDASAISQRLLRDDDSNIMLAAYEQLLRLDDIAVSRDIIARSIYLDRISSAGHQAIFVSRSGLPRIVIFGAPIYCRPDTFIRYEDGSITIDAPLASGGVRLILKIPNIPPITVECSYKLSDIIVTLCEEATVKDSSGRKPGLNVPYCDMTAIIRQMCEKGALLAEFKAGPLPKID